MKWLNLTETVGVAASLLLLGLSPVEGSFDAKTFRQQDRQGRERTAQAIRDERTRVINDLIRVAATKEISPPEGAGGFPKDGVWHGAKHLAILLLGDLRASEAVPVLMRNLGYRNPEKTDLPRLRLKYSGFAYPAANSLSKIGVPAVPPLLEELKTLEEAEPKRAICIWTLKSILGKELAKSYLGMAIKEAEDDKSRGNLKAALEQLLRE